MELLTSTSPRYHQTHGYVQLMPHQEALLYRCIELEYNTNVGILADSPGSGKTFVVLSLIIMDVKSINVIVVPQNIYTQWDTAIKQFCGETVTYSKFITYGDVSALYFQPSKLSSNIILTTPLYYNIIIDALQSSQKKISRVFVDEIDSVVNIIQNIKNKRICDMIWFISASVTETTLETMGFNPSLFNKIACRCNLEFIKNSFNLPEPQLQTLVCRNVLIDHILYGMISEEEYSRLNAMDYNGIQKLNSIMVAKNEKEAVDYFMKDLMDSEQQLTTTISDIENQLSNNVLNEESQSKLQLSLEQNKGMLQEVCNKIKCMKERLIEYNICNICYCDIEDKVITVCCKNIYCNKCLTVWINKSTTKSCPMCRVDNISVISMFEENNKQEDNTTSIGSSQEVYQAQQKTKIEQLTDLLKYTVGDKVIIFADYTSVFQEISKLLERENIKYVELDGGSITAIDRDINEYKNGQARVLMTNSSLYGCGMNLENTTDIILLHKTNVSMKEQVIGRAQRPGRTSQLKVWELMHGNEIEINPDV